MTCKGFTLKHCVFLRVNIVRNIPSVLFLSRKPELSRLTPQKCGCCAKVQWSTGDQAALNGRERYCYATVKTAQEGNHLWLRVSKNVFINYNSHWLWHGFRKLRITLSHCIASHIHWNKDRLVIHYWYVRPHRKSLWPGQEWRQNTLEPRQQAQIQPRARGLSSDSARLTQLWGPYHTDGVSEIHRWCILKTTNNQMNSEHSGEIKRQLNMNRTTWKPPKSVRVKLMLYVTAEYQFPRWLASLYETDPRPTLHRFEVRDGELCSTDSAAVVAVTPTSLLPGPSTTPDTWAEKFESFELINSIRATNGNFDSCNSCKRLGTSRLHELRE